MANRPLRRLIALTPPAQETPPRPASPRRAPALLSRTAALAELGVGWHTLAAMIANGEIHAVRCGKRDKIPAAEVARWRGHERTDP